MHLYSRKNTNLFALRADSANTARAFSQVRGQQCHLRPVHTSPVVQHTRVQSAVSQARGALALPGAFVCALVAQVAPVPQRARSVDRCRASAPWRWWHTGARARRGHSPRHSHLGSRALNARVRPWILFSRTAVDLVHHHPATRASCARGCAARGASPSSRRRTRTRTLPREASVLFPRLVFEACE